ncbi:hypothetical protein FKM82_027914 [Ascaphus truei]
MSPSCYAARKGRTRTERRGSASSRRSRFPWWFANTRSPCFRPSPLTRPCETSSTRPVGEGVVGEQGVGVGVRRPTQHFIYKYIYMCNMHLQ